MQQLIELLDINTTYILLALIGVTFVLLILTIILFIKNARLKKRYNSFMRGDQVDIEELLKQCISKTDNVEKEHKLIKENIVQTQSQLKYCIQKIGIVRYNAISGVGADLSFVIALLDGKDNGVVVNGIYTRDGSYTYAKPVVNGDSKYTLSDEEIEAIKKSKDILGCDFK